MKDVRAGIGVVFREAVDFLVERLLIGDEEWEALVREVDDAARARASDMNAAMSRDILTAIKEAVEKGTTQREFDKDFETIARRHGWTGDNTQGRRSELIFRTLTSQATAAGRWRQIMQLKDRMPWVRYVTAGDPRVRPEHAAWHGVILRWDDPWWDTHFPPNGFNCRCHVMALADDDLVRYGWTPAEKAPFSATEIRSVRGPDGVQRMQEVIKGIDPGFAFNVGKIGMKPQDPGGGLFGSLPRQWSPVPSNEAEALTLADRIAEGQASWESTLTGIEKDAIETYKGLGYSFINSMLRGDKIDEDDYGLAVWLAETLAGALERARLPKAVTTFRGVPQHVADEYYAQPVGQTFIEPSFVSSSLLEEKAHAFGDFIIEAIYPSEAEAIALVHFIPHIMNAEIEMLLAPGKRFRVLARGKGRMLVEIVS